MRIRRIIMLAVALVVAGTLIATNPRRGEYVKWAIEKAQPGSGHSLSRAIRPETAPMYVDEATVSRDYGLFSLYYTEIEDGNSLVTLGICRQLVLVRGYGMQKEE